MLQVANNVLITKIVESLFLKIIHLRTTAYLIESSLDDLLDHLFTFF